MHTTLYDLQVMQADNIIKGSRQRLRHFGYYDLQWKVGDVYSPGPWVVHTN
jgi:hypothetical protein